MLRTCGYRSSNRRHGRFDPHLIKPDLTKPDYISVPGWARPFNGLYSLNEHSTGKARPCRADPVSTSHLHNRASPSLHTYKSQFSGHNSQITTSQNLLSTVTYKYNFTYKYSSQVTKSSHKIIVLSQIIVVSLIDFK